MKQKDPPWRVALAQAVGSIRQRPVRQIAAGLGVALGIALFTGVQTSRLLSPPTTPDIENQERLKLLVFLSLVLSLTGIVNSMLMSVTERYREIGTLKCLGARNSFIVKVFLIESAIIGLVSSAFGVLLGAGTMVLIKYSTGGLPDSFGIGLLSIIGTSLAMGVGITIFAAVLPAIQASRMSATAALRVEI